MTGIYVSMLQLGVLLPDSYLIKNLDHGRLVIGMGSGWYWLMILYNGGLWCEW
jgi:hypothetical protein